MSAHGSSDEATHPLLRRRRRAELFASTYLQASVRKIPKVTKQAAAATVALLLLVVAAGAFLSRGDRTPGARPLHDFGNQDDASLLLAKATGMRNSDEAKTLLKALQDGTLDYGTVSSALEEDAAREKAKIKAEVEKEASRKAAEEKAAAAEKAAADKANAEKAAAKKAAEDKAAAERASQKMHKAVPRSLIDVFHENDDDYYDEDFWLGDELEDETDDGVDDLALSRREQKRSVSFNSQGGGRAPSITGKDRAPSTRRSRNKVDRKGPSSLSDDISEEEEDDWLGGEVEDEIDDGDSLAFPRREQKRSAFFNNQGGGRAPSRKGKGRAQGASSWRNKVDRKGHPSLSDDTGGEEEDDSLARGK